MTTVRCPECSASLKAPAALVGKNAKCPKCGCLIPVPCRKALDEDEILAILEEGHQPCGAERRCRSPPRRAGAACVGSPARNRWLPSRGSTSPNMRGGHVRSTSGLRRLQ